MERVRRNRRSSALTKGAYLASIPILSRRESICCFVARIAQLVEQLALNPAAAGSGVRHQENFFISYTAIALIAQLAEQLALNQTVPGSTPGGGTEKQNTAIALVAQWIEQGSSKALMLVRFQPRARKSGSLRRGDYRSMVGRWFVEPSTRVRFPLVTPVEISNALVAERIAPQIRRALTSKK